MKITLEEVTDFLPSKQPSCHVLPYLIMSHRPVTMDQSSVQEAPSSLCCNGPCRRIAALPCTSCENAPSTSGSIVPSTYYCTQECANSDWPRHMELCLVSRERRALFDAAKEMQRLYYTACDLELKFVVTNGVKVGTEVYYDPAVLQRRMCAVSRNK